MWGAGSSHAQRYETSVRQSSESASACRGAIHRASSTRGRSWQQRGLRMLPTDWRDASHTAVTATTDHLSFRVPRLGRPHKIANALVDWFKALGTGRSAVNQPSAVTSPVLEVKGCRSCPTAVISSTGAPASTAANSWSGSRTNCTAPVEVEFPKSWKVVDYKGAGASLQARSRGEDRSDRSDRVVGVGCRTPRPRRAVASGGLGDAVSSGATRRLLDRHRAERRVDR